MHPTLYTCTLGDYKLTTKKLQVGRGGLTGQVSPLIELLLNNSLPSTTLACLLLSPLRLGHTCTCSSGSMSLY